MTEFQIFNEQSMLNRKVNNWGREREEKHNTVEFASSLFSLCFFARLATHLTHVAAQMVTTIDRHCVRREK